MNFSNFVYFFTLLKINFNFWSSVVEPFKFMRKCYLNLAQMHISAHVR